MPKTKTHSGLKKRLKVTGTGKLVHQKCNHGHILTKKSAKRRRHLRQDALTPATIQKRLRRLMVM
jgi:large subunit ribosomal protein L35